MKYRTIQKPHVKGSISLKDAMNAAKAASSNGSHNLSDAEKVALMKKGILYIPKSVGSSALKQSHSRPTATAKTKRRPTTGKKAASKSVSARKK